ncbi:MAG: hypothetical protein K8L97_14105 [Anaerolineae bacterium]|nr:hypothetical protein [Anaerolineae bacterium]
MTTFRWDVLGVGSATVDDFLYLAAYPQPDTKNPVLRTERQGGGLTATAMVAAARLGAKVGYAGLLGHDPISQWVESDLVQEGIDVSQVVHRDDAQPIHATIIVEQEHHTRTILYSVKGHIGADESLPEAEIIRSTRVLFVDDFGIPGGIRAATIAREAGVAVVGDFERVHTPDLPRLLDLVDHLILSERFATAFTGTSTPAEAMSALWRDDRALVAVTGGAKGCWYITHQDDIPHHQGAFPVEVVDTTGCGDVFHGAYAATLTWGFPASERIRFASVTAALKATQPGGRKGIPGREQVEKVLSNKY